MAFKAGFNFKNNNSKWVHFIQQESLTHVSIERFKSGESFRGAGGETD
jgi:hypothetical protein